MSEEQISPAPLAHSPEHDIAAIAASDLFDAAWYLDAYPDVAATGIDPLLHYVLHGASERRDPSEFFSTDHYLRSNPDVVDSPFNPLVHYVLHGIAEGRAASPASGADFAPFPFERLMRVGLAAVAEQMARDATPAERLARPDPQLFSPLVSFILPVFNTPERFLREVVQSVRAQTYGHWELCIVDDCSTRSETLSVLEELRQDERVRLHRMERNAGIAKSSDMALAHATGDYVAFVDHDDLLTPNALSEVVALLRQDSGIDYIYSDHVQASPEGLPRAWARKPSWSPDFLLSTNYIVHFKLVRRELLCSIGGLAQERSQVQDLAMSLRILRAGARVAQIPQALYLWREHKGSVAASTSAKPGIEGLLAETYTEHLHALGSHARAFWPAAFRKQRVGAFRLKFPQTRARVVQVAIVSPTALNKGSFERAAVSGKLDVAPVHWITTARHAPEGVCSLPTDAAVRKFFTDLEADYVVLTGGQARVISPVGFEALTGYLDLSQEIGAVGGKVLNDQLQVIAGGFLLSKGGDYGLICGGEFDNAEGHWLLGQVASNVDGVSARCMAVRRSALAGGPGLKLCEWREFAGLVFCQELRAVGSRVVYNPAVKLLDSDRLRVSPLAAQKLKQHSRAHVGDRVFTEFADG